jgi:hypothetical protein
MHLRKLQARVCYLLMDLFKIKNVTIIMEEILIKLNEQLCKRY